LNRRMHYFQHVPFEWPAYIMQYAYNNGIDIKGTALFADEELPQSLDFDILLIMGGPMGIYDENKYNWLRREKKFIERAIANNKKIIGICLGAQLIADVLGATVSPGNHKEIGWYQLTTTLDARQNKIGKVLPASFYAFHWHGDTFEIPDGAVHICKSDAYINQAFIYDERIIGFQFHLESTEDSVKLLLKNCSSEIDNGGVYVQNSSQITDSIHISSSNKIMEKIIEEIL